MAATQLDVNDVLAIKFGNPANFPEWVKPFNRAVDVLNLLAQEETRKTQGIDPEYFRDGWDTHYLEEAESKLLSAIDLSGRKEALPYAWLASLYMKIQAYPKASAAGRKAVQFEPLHPSWHGLLAQCYEKEKEYIKAYETLQRAFSLVPPADRQRHQNHHLAEFRARADAMKASLVTDPFIRLPLNVITNIMQFGLEEDRHFVLVASWTNRKWRQTLVHKCPVLWGILTLPWRELKDKFYLEKHEAWIERSRGKFHTIEIEDITVTGVVKVPKAYTAYMRMCQNLRITTTQNKAFFRLVERFANKFEKLQHLYMDGGDLGNERYRNDYLDNDLHCLLVDSLFRKRLQTIEIHNVDYREPHVPAWRTDEHGAPDYYPDLRRLTLSGCRFGSFDFDPASYDEDDIVNKYYDIERCVLHRTLWNADQLEYLKVVCHPSVAAQGGSKRQKLDELLSERWEMTNLQEIVLPPPTVWTIDLYGPNIKSLDFVLPNAISRRSYEARPLAERMPLIPDIKESPVSIDNLARLTHLGFECCSTDMLPRLGQWVSRVPNLVSLSLHGTTNIPPLENSPPPAYRVDVCILEAFIAHPEWMPNLTDLQLIHCDVPDNQLVQFVHTRRLSPDMAPLTRLSICSQKQLLPESHTWLHQAVIKRDGSGSGFSYTTRDRGGAGEDRCDCVR